MGLATLGRLTGEELNSTPWEHRERNVVVIQPSLRHWLFLAAWVNLLSLRLSFTAQKLSPRHWPLGNISHFKLGRRRAVDCGSSFLPKIQSHSLSQLLKSNFLLWFHSFSINACLLHTKPDLPHLRLSPSPPFCLATAQIHGAQNEHICFGYFFFSRASKRNPISVLSPLTTVAKAAFIFCTIHK